MSSSESPFLNLIFHHQGREALVVECPALALLCYQHVVASLTHQIPIEDPFAATGCVDAVSELLAVESTTELLDRVFTEPQAGKLWVVIRAVLEELTLPPSGRSSLHFIAGRSHFALSSNSSASTSNEGVALSSTSLCNAVDMSRRFLQSATACALAGSTGALGDGRHQALRSILQFAHLVPTSNSDEVTSEGLNFCMMSLPQQWWLLVSGALDRVLALNQTEPLVTLPRLWQALAVLAALDTVRHMYGFPDKNEDLIGYHVLARLAEVGLVYPVKTANGTKCFVLSPHMAHALQWHASTPICVSSMIGAASSEASRSVRREDTDTIITEANFRLYAYTRNPELLHILNQFAECEERVGGCLTCYRLTRNSFAAALRKGISTLQILKFLSLRAHPSMLHKYGEDAHATAENVATVRSSRQRTVASTSWAIPQSLCDQLFMWESECNRVRFTRQVVMLRNMTLEQQTYLERFLGDLGKGESLIYREPGTCVVRQEVYERYMAGSVPEE